MIEPYEDINSNIMKYIDNYEISFKLHITFKVYRYTSFYEIDSNAKYVYTKVIFNTIKPK